MRPRNPIPAYLEHATGQARITIGTTDYYLGTYGSQFSRILYSLVLSEYYQGDGAVPDKEWFEGQKFLLRSYNPDRHGAKNPVIMAMVTAVFRPQIDILYPKGQDNPNWYRLNMLCDLVDQMFGQLSVDDFSPDHYKKLRARLLEKNNRQTTNELMSKVIKICQFAEGEGNLLTTGDIQWSN